jgi:hypothetical protein
MSKQKKFKFDLLAEDLTMASNNFMGNQTGQGSGVTRPKKMSIMDLLKAQDDLKKRQDDAPGVLPYPVNTSVLDKFADAYHSINDVKNILKQTINNPIISTDKTNKKAVTQMYKKCNKVQELIELCGEDLDILLPRQAEE